MKLSAPIYVLKAQAKKIKKLKSISMAEALNEVAQKEGYSSWGLLQSKAKDLLPRTQKEILAYLNPGDLVLIGSRPGLGKTSFALKLLLQAVEEGRRSALFTLEESKKKIAKRIADINEDIGENHPHLIFDFSDDISADHIIQRVDGRVSTGSLITIDYLQLLDQRRDKPDLQIQIAALKAFAKKHGCILIFISQLDRKIEDVPKKRPDLKDIKLPNPVDLRLFNKILFLHDGKVLFASPHRFELP